MVSYDPEGWSSTEYKLLSDDDDSSSSSSESSNDDFFPINPSSRNKQKYKKILIEEDLLPE